MDRADAVALMKGSKSEADWNENCDLVKDSDGNYPDWWFKAIMISGVARDTQASWRARMN